MLTARRSDERGIALIMTLFLSLMVAGMAVGIILMMGNSNLVAKFHSTEAMMEAAADAGLEQARDQLNGSPALLPTTGFVTLENNVNVTDATGAVIPGFTRSTYAGNSGNITGQYGVFASVITVISNARGAVVVRRSELTQAAFSKYARFFNTWSCCSWGNTEVVFGPVHSNQGMALQTGAPGATFNGPVTTVSSITNQSSGNWNGGVTTGVAAIPFPTTVTLANMQTYANTGNTNVAGYPTATAVDPDTRIEFVALDLNGDGNVTGADEGFFRVWKASAAGTPANNRAYVTARRWGVMPGGLVAAGGGVNNATTLTPSATNDPNLISPNCGGRSPTFGIWMRNDSIWANAVLATAAQKEVEIRNADTSATRQCFLGGDRRLYPNVAGIGQWIRGNQYGTWQNWAGWGGAPPAALVNYFANNPVTQPIHPGGGMNAVVGGTPTQMALTFWPLSRSLNVNFKGVVYVTGSVAVSGTVRGRATVVATGNIILPDDINYVQPPNTNCVDILGMLTTNNAVVEDNSLNTPFRVKNLWTVRFDDTPDETFQSFILTLGNFQGENIPGTDLAPAAPENCAGKSRGCKSIMGGTIQQGVSGTFSGSSGWAETDTWDACGSSSPPPYYPTTGRFNKNRQYEIDPVGFNVAAWYAANQ